MNHSDKNPHMPDNISVLIQVRNGKVCKPEFIPGTKTLLEKHRFRQGDLDLLALGANEVIISGNRARYKLEKDVARYSTLRTPYATIVGQDSTLEDLREDFGKEYNLKAKKHPTRILQYWQVDRPANSGIFALF